MNLSLCPDAAPGFLSIFDLSIAPPLLLYSYIPIFILCIFFGFYISQMEHNSVQSKYFFGITLSFATWILLILFQWVAVYLEIVHLAWQLLLLPEILIFLFSVLFAYVFLFKKDAPALYKSFVVLILMVAAVVLPTRLNINSFDLENCEGVVGTTWSIVYVFEWVCLSIIILTAIRKVNVTKEKDQKFQAVLFSSGLVFFLGIFWASNYFAELTKAYEINLIGPLGMFLFIGVLSYMMVKFKIFASKLFASQILVIALWVLVAALLFIQQINYIHIVVVFTLGLVGFLGISLIRSVKREIVQREKIEKLAVELEDANHNLQELDRQKDELLSIVSHQLATPISAVKWNLEMMLDGDMGKLTKDQEEHIKIIQPQTESLADLASMILNVSRIQLGRMKADRIELDVQKFVEEVFAEIEPKAKEKGIHFTKSISKNIPKMMLDKRLLRMTMENLLTNAVRYTPKGGKVELRAEMRGENLHYEVQDTGCGIPEGEQGKIFGKLFRASNVLNIEGNGFGLYIAKGSVEAQGGTISFRSKEGKGTTFIVDLPIVKQEKNYEKKSA